MSVPKGIIEFADLALCSPYKTKLLRVRIITILTVILPILLISFYSLPIFVILLSITIGASIYLVFSPDLEAIIATPLGVNINHPFVDEEPIGKAIVSVKLSTNDWIDIGEHRVRLVEDELQRGFNLVEDHEDYTTLGHFSDSINKVRLSKQVIIINQALALRDVVNGKADPIEEAREREAMDYGLLERDWLGEEELNVEGPLAKFINKE
ncbi:MAG: hypothetical protein CMA66_02945 [Euryarchaeota archaeon]|nr:hypothetical protein [Euryarchaeota archaeon]